MADYNFPAAALDDRLAIVGTAGSGKTYTASAFAERLLKRGDKVVIVDPLGVMWGLRLNSDGKSASEFSPVIFGGEHADVPINDRAGELVGETVATVKDSAIIDLSGLGTKGAERRFMLAFLTALYRKHNGTPLHLIIDEADMFAPQKLLDREIDAAKLLGQMETIVRRGRVRGFIPWLITQRPAVLSKDVLSQADGLIAMKLTSSQDRAAIGGWIEGQADQVTGKEILASLPAKQRGSGVVWIPGRGILAHADFPKKITFDSSKAPARGEKKVTAHLKPIDIEAIKGKLEVVTAEAKANDPVALKGEISRLNTQIVRLNSELTKAGAQVRNDPEAIAKADADGFQRGYMAGGKAGIDDGSAIGQVTGLSDAMAIVENFLKKSADTIEALNISHAGLGALLSKALGDAKASPDFQRAMSDIPKSIRATRDFKAPAVVHRVPAAEVERRGNSAPARSTGPGEEMPGPQRKLLTVLAQYPQGRTKKQLAVLAGYAHNGGAFNNPLSNLRAKGWAQGGPDRLVITEAGIAALGAWEPLPTGDALREYWFGNLEGPQAKLLRALCNHYPRGLTKHELASEAGYEVNGGAFNNPLSRLRALELITGRGGEPLKASEDLFG